MLTAEGRRPRAGDRHATHRRRPGRWFLGALAAALALTALAASSAQAAGGEDTVEFGCKSVTVKFFGFPSGETTKVKMKLTVDGKQYSYTIGSFIGPEGEFVLPVEVPPGHHSMDVFAKWETNGVKGGHDQPLKGGITCEPDPKYTIVKKQRRGGKGSYSTEEIGNGKVGEKIEYGIVVTNTGNVPLTLSNFSDPVCDEGTLTGGPGANPVPPAPTGKTTYFCTHTLTESDHLAGTVCNIATVTATPPEGDGEPITQESNKACTFLPTPKDKREFSCKGITFIFEGFPNMPGNTVKMHIRVDGVLYPGPTPKNWVEFTFNGPSATYTFPLNLSPGHHGLDGQSKWSTNGFKGGSDFSGSANCTAEPNFSIEKTQKVQGSEAGFTSHDIEVEAGQTMEYLITITNTGNVGFKIPSFQDKFREDTLENFYPESANCSETSCEEGAGGLKCHGGPGEAEVKPEAITQYECERTVDEEAGGEKVRLVANEAFAEADPTEGANVNKTSNTVFGELE